MASCLDAFSTYPLNTFIGLGMLLNFDDTGALLGLALSSIVASAGVAISHIIGTLKETFSGKTYDLLNFGNLKAMTKISSFVFLAYLIIAIYSNPTILLGADLIGSMFIPGTGDEFDWDAPGEDFLMQLPALVMGFFISVISLGVVVLISDLKSQLIPFGKGFGVAKAPHPVSTVTRIYVIAKSVLSIICFISFFIKIGMHHVRGDYFVGSLSLLFD